MKTTLFLILLTCNFLTFGQIDTAVSKTSLESFSARSGSILEKKWFDIGEMSKAEIKIRVLQIKDLTTNQKTAGAVIETHIPYGSSYNVQNRTAYLDMDEIDGLIKAVNYIKANLDTVPLEYTELKYTSRGDFEFGVFLQNNKWTVYLQTSDYSNSTVYLKVTEIDYFLQRIIECQTKLNQLMAE